MDFDFFQAKNGEQTCTCRGISIHSKYNPSSEGEKFAQGISADFTPLCIIIIEPALSYCAPFLRKKFPKAKLCAIRFTGAFKAYDNQWDYVFYTEKNSMLMLSEDLFNALGEENLISALVFDWAPSKNIFPEENLNCWQEAKKSILKSRDVLGTRAYFSKRWIKNLYKFAKSIKNTQIVKSIKSPVIIAASGPSLSSSLEFIKKNQEKFFIIALSSAYSALIKNNITPDLVFSTDGGFWAKKHLLVPGLCAYNHSKKTVFAIEAEGALFKTQFENTILPLCYDDGLERKLLDEISCPYMLSKRNGTVAGTALEFSFENTKESIYLCGYDQAPGFAFQHTQPNALENGNAARDSRLNPAETRITKSRFNSIPSLEIYRNWFISNSERFCKRVFRVSDNYNYDFSLGHIKDINWSEVHNLTSLSKKNIETQNYTLNISEAQRSRILKETLQKISMTKEFENELFPLDNLLISREIDSKKKENLQEKLNKKIEHFVQEIYSR